MRISLASGINTDGYVAFEHIIGQHPGDVPRSVAKKAHIHFMGAKDKQLERFRSLLHTNNLTLSGGSGDIRAINAWVNRGVCCTTARERDVNGEFYHHLHPDWSNVLFDMHIFLSELVIQNTANVQWHFNINVTRNDVSFQQTVLSGFSKVRSKRYNVDLGLALFNYASEIAEDPETASDDRFNFLVESAILDDVNLETAQFTHSDFAKDIGL